VLRSTIGHASIIGASQFISCEIVEQQRRLANRTINYVKITLCLCVCITNF